jgi:hypothetical protein
MVGKAKCKGRQRSLVAQAPPDVDRTIRLYSKALTRSSEVQGWARSALTIKFALPNFQRTVIAIGKRNGGSALSGDAVSRTGLRRVDWVRLTEESGQYRAEVIGEGFRLPVTRPIPLSLAAELIAAGVPHLTRSAAHHRAGA